MKTITRAVVPGCMALFLMLWASPLNAKVLNMSGTWKLNVEKSDFGPKGSTLKIVHKEPAFKLSYTATYPEGQQDSAEFDGAIDGKPYKETGPQGGSTATFRRINDSTVERTLTSPDGKTTDTVTLTVSKDGKVFTGKGTGKGTEGEYKYSVVYEKQ
jgi:hypothetical protein